MCSQETLIIELCRPTLYLPVICGRGGKERVQSRESTHTSDWYSSTYVTSALRPSKVCVSVSVFYAVTYARTYCLVMAASSSAALCLACANSTNVKNRCLLGAQESN